jgi:hypothetical protein
MYTACVLDGIGSNLAIDMATFFDAAAHAARSGDA